MAYLIVDTSTDYCILAIGEKGKLLTSEIKLHANLLSKFLFLSIQNLLNTSSLDFQQLEAVCLGIGPGSYTGTRVGAAAAKSLAFGLGIPLVPFCSLKAFLPFSFDTCFLIKEAKNGTAFVLKAEYLNQNFQFFFFPHHPLTSIQALIPENVSFISFDKALLKKHLSKEPNDPIPNVSPLAQICYKKLLEFSSESPEEILINYLHTPSTL